MAIWFPYFFERFSVVWVSRLGVLSLGVWGVVLLLGDVSESIISTLAGRFLHH